MSKKLKITSNFADRLADAVRQFGGRAIERAAGVSTGTVSLITGGKQTLIGEAVLERLSLALEDLWERVAPAGNVVAQADGADPATCRRDTPNQDDERAGIVPVESEMACAGELGDNGESVARAGEIPDGTEMISAGSFPLPDEDIWQQIDDTYNSGYKVGRLRGEIDGMVALIRVAAGHDDTVARACGIISLTADRLAEMAVPE